MKKNKLSINRPGVIGDFLSIFAYWTVLVVIPIVIFNIFFWHIKIEPIF